MAAPARKHRARVAALGLGTLALGLAMLCTCSSDRGNLRLPVGNHPPAICLGERHGLILASDGSLWTWGSDLLGWPVLGLGKVMKTTTLRQIGHDKDWVSISAGETHNLAVKADGTLWTWGASTPGRFTMSVPIPTPEPAAPGHDWKQAAAGGIHSVAIKKDGTLWGWGNNWAGSAGIPSTNGSAAPVQIGSATNWVRVWASTLESVGLQSDGTLWYWGDNPNPALAQDVGQISVPTRVNADTNWVDVGFGVNTMFAIKSDGTLWAWGRQAHAYTGASPAQDTRPMRIGTNTDWQSISASAGWWCQGLIKKDGSLWLMDASDGLPNGPRPPYKPVRFRRIDLRVDYVAYAGGATHAAAPGVHGPIGVVLTRDGEVWTWGMVLGDPPTLRSRLQDLGVALARAVHVKVGPMAPPPVFRQQPWQLRNE